MSDDNTHDKMHEGELEINQRLVARLIETQFPQWANLPLKRLKSAGTVNAIYRLGDRMVARLPLVAGEHPDIAREHAWLPRLGPHLSVPIPMPLGLGRPTDDYPCPWCVYSWLEGENPVPGELSDPITFARDLANFIRVLQSINTDGAPESERGRRTLAGLDVYARAALEQSRGLIDVSAATRAWNAALRGPAWDGKAVWVHADLLPGNVLVKDGRLSGVIDFGSVGTGDPASDLNVAWSVLPFEARAIFRTMLDADNAAWNRARGLALLIALQALPYYINSNPTFASVARYVIEQVLEDHERGV
jgi:aminoglycoside phosphotransferase (APT) family kinase protein